MELSNNREHNMTFTTNKLFLWLMVKCGGLWREGGGEDREAGGALMKRK